MLTHKWWFNVIEVTDELSPTEDTLVITGVISKGMETEHVCPNMSIESNRDSVIPLGQVLSFIQQINQKGTHCVVFRGCVVFLSNRILY